MLNNFPVIDVTHKPERTQRENVEGRVEEVIEKEDFLSNHFTLERAIKFYSNYKTAGREDLERMFRKTAEWLSDYMTIKKSREE